MSTTSLFSEESVEVVCSPEVPRRPSAQPQQQQVVPPVQGGWFRRNAPIISLCSIPIALASIVVALWNPRAMRNADKADEAFWLKVDSRIESKSGTIRDGLSKVEQSIAHLDGVLQGILAVQKGFAQKIPNVPEDLPKILHDAAAGRGAQPALPVYLVAARQQGFRMPIQEVDEIGRELLSRYGRETASDSTPWQSILELLNYRSYLNLVTPTEIRTLQLMIRPDPAIGPPEWFVNMAGHATRVVYRDTQMYYNGTSPLELQTVSFTNCVFYMPPTDKSRELANAILSQRYITITIK